MRLKECSGEHPYPLPEDSITMLLYLLYQSSFHYSKFFIEKVIHAQRGKIQTSQCGLMENYPPSHTRFATPFRKSNYVLTHACMDRFSFFSFLRRKKHRGQICSQGPGDLGTCTREVILCVSSFMIMPITAGLCLALFFPPAKGFLYMAEGYGHR